LNLFELFVKVGVDDQASGNLKSIGQKLGNGLKTAAKVGAAAVGLASAAITALTTQAVNSFAEYEQLAGGAQKIFDQMDYSKIATDANNAYKELGLSANQYLSVINDVGATFAATMGDEAGYEAAKTGLKAISDYASGTGKNVDELSQKFTLITRSTSSYQSIADQFSGILPATSDAFLEQAQAAGILSDNYTKLTEVPIEEYQAAVSKMLQQGVADLGLANNTMNEAFSTLSGSLSMAKGAWSNLVTGLADDSADLDMLISNFVESVGAVATNLIPKIGTALNGASKLVRDLIPVIVQEIPVLIEENLPILAEAAISIIQSLADGISQNQGMLMTTAFETIVFLANSLISMLPQIVALGLDLIVSLANGIAESLPELIPTIVDVVLQIVDTLTDPETLSNLIDAAIAIIVALADGLIDSLPELLEKAPEIVQNLVDAIIENAPKLLESSYEMIVKIVEGIIENLPQILEAGAEIVFSILEGITELLGDLIMKGKDIVDSVKDGFSQKVEDAKTWGKDLIDNFIGGITEKWNALKEKVSSVAQTVKDYLGFSEPKKGPLSNFHTYAPDMMDLFAKGIRDNENVITDQIEKSFDFGERTMKFGAEYDDGFGITKSRGTAYGGTSIGNITINIDGAKYSDENALADAIAERLQIMADRRDAVYA
jgi:phage-related protein